MQVFQTSVPCSTDFVSSLNFTCPAEVPDVNFAAEACNDVCYQDTYPALQSIKLDSGALAERLLSGPRWHSQLPTSHSAQANPM